MSDEWQRWLDGSNDRAKAALREALDESEKFTHSEVRQRRVWARVSEPRRTTQVARHAFLRGALAASIATAALVVGAARFHVFSPAAGIHFGAVATSNVAGTQTEPIPSAAPAGALLETRAGERLVRVLSRGARAELSPLTTVALDGDGRPELRRGEVRFTFTSAPKASSKFSVTVASYHVVVASSRFVVKSQSETVTVTVEDGVAEIDDGGRVVRIGSGETWSSSGPRASRDRARHALSRPARDKETVPAEAPSLTNEQDRADRTDLAAARAARSGSDPRAALALYEKLASRGGAVSENAMYEIGGIYHDQLKQPTKAVAAWDRYRTRYPSGLLRAETDLSVIDTLVSLGDEKRTLSEALAFLKRYPHSERRGEVARVAGDIYRGDGKCAAALEFYRVAQGAKVTREDADDAAFGQAACLYAMRDDGSRAALRGYLDQNPRGRHARDAARLLGDKPTP